jgi:hypothetical protein
MKGRIFSAAAVMVAAGWLSYTAISRSRGPGESAFVSGTPVSEGEKHSAIGTPAQSHNLTEIAPRPNDVVVPEPKNGVNVCPTIITDDVSDALLARTKYRSRSELASFLQMNSLGYNAMRRELIPEFIKAARDVQACYQAEPEDQAIAHLGIHIRASHDRAAVHDIAVLRIDAPPDSRARVQDCLEHFKKTRLPISVEAPQDEPFAEYDDLYLKEVPLLLGPRSKEHLLSVRNSERQSRDRNGR